LLKTEHITNRDHWQVADVVLWTHLLDITYVFSPQC